MRIHEIVGASAAKLAKYHGRASFSFSGAELWWLYEVVYATLTHNLPRIEVLAGDPVGQKCAQKLQVAKRAAEENRLHVDKRRQQKSLALVEAPANGTDGDDE